MMALAGWWSGWRWRLLAGAGCLALGFVLGWSLRDRLAVQASRQAALAEAGLQVRAAHQALATAAASAAISDRLGRKLEADQAQVRIVYRTLKEEVPSHVTPEADRRCAVPVGFVRLHDAAAAGRQPAAVPDSAGGSDDAASGLALSTVAATVVDNYGTCAELRRQVVGWQDWYQAERAAWPVATGGPD